MSRHMPLVFPVGLAACAIFGSVPALAQSGDGSGIPPSDSGVIKAPTPSVSVSHDSVSVPREPATDQWSIELRPSAWYVAPSGKVRLPASSSPTRGDKVPIERLNLDSTRFAPQGDFTIRSGGWSFRFDGAAYSLERDTTADASFRLGDTGVRAGDPTRVTFDFAGFDVLAGYRVLDHEFTGTGIEPGSFRARVDVLGGLGLYDLDIGIRSLAAGGQESRTDQFFAQPVLGARLELVVVRDVVIDLTGMGGYMADSDRSSASFDLAVSFEWRPAPNFGARLGWRQIAYAFDDGSGRGEFSYDGTMAGLFFGVTVRF
ncbi:MAG: hypothetical protein JNM07_03475 [Phycisphaerae bacterium]|nr:hypothetical protein [Phycisphaerae bacterium]